MRFSGDDLKEAIMQALFTEKKSELGQGGFWGESLTQEELQSTLWQHYPGLATPENLQGAQNAAQETMAPWVEQGTLTAIYLEPLPTNSNPGNVPLQMTVTLKNHPMLKLP